MIILLYLTAFYGGSYLQAWYLEWGDQRRLQVNPLQISSVCQTAEGLLFALTRRQLREHVFTEHVRGSPEEPHVCGGHVIYVRARAGTGHLVASPVTSQIQATACLCMARERNVKKVTTFRDMRKYTKSRSWRPQMERFWPAAHPFMDVLPGAANSTAARSRGAHEAQPILRLALCRKNGPTPAQ